MLCKFLIGQRNALNRLWSKSIINKIKKKYKNIKKYSKILIHTYL